MKNFSCLCCNKTIQLDATQRVEYRCEYCKKSYPIIEEVILAVDEDSDFFNYNRKLERFLKFRTNS